jgi:nicotinate-nucleotide adenylyltransferase
VKKIGLYFGSFNPVHIGHLIIAEYFATQTELDEVWFIISPHNPLKEASQLAGEDHRLTMVRLAINGSDYLQASDIEFAMEKPSYSYKTLQTLTETFPKYAFTMIMGEDNLSSFHLWKEYEWILKNFPVRVFPRPGVDRSASPIDWSAYDVQMVQAPQMEISATQIRKNIATGHSNRYMLTDEVISYIKKHKLYLSLGS